MNKIIKKIIRFYVKKTGSDVFRSMHPYADMVARGEFDSIYQKGLTKTGTPPSIWRKDRFFNLYSFAKGLPKDALTIECGAWKGLSSYLICLAMRSSNSAYNGEGHHVVDSFEGLSAPVKEDGLSESLKGHFAYSLDRVKENLNSFSDIQYIPGYIPEILNTIPERKWDLVHVDVDLVEPTTSAIRYFFPRLAPDGLIICDDYASTLWPGTKNAVDEICKELDAQIIPLSTGQLIIMRR